MSNLNIKDGIDTTQSVNSFIPTGALMMKAMSASVLPNYDTDAEAKDAGYIPCDGRSLSTYDADYINLHKTIGGLYGNGTPYSAGITDVSGTYTRTATSGNIISSDYSTFAYVQYLFSNSDLLFGYNSTPSNGGIVYSYSTTQIVIYYPAFIAPSSNVITLNKTFFVPNLRSVRKYLYGVANASGGVYYPYVSSNVTNTITHSHTVSGISGQTFLTNNVAGSHTHTASYTFNNDGYSHSHNSSHNMPGFTTGQALGTTLNKADGTGTAAGAAHTHTVNAYVYNESSGAAGPGHSHSGSSASDSYTEPTHSHSIPPGNVSIPSSSSLEVPYINMLYFIKI